MNIAMIGTGNVGGALGRAFAGLGHAVVFGARPRGPAGPRPRRGGGSRPRHACRVRTRGRPRRPRRAGGAPAVEAARALGDLAGKILLDTTNPVGPGLLPTPDPAGRSLAERVAEAASGARVVKGFHTLAAEHMGQGRLDGRPAALFLCGDDADAKAAVAGLAEGLGFEAVDVGGLDRARLTEPLALVWITLAVRQGLGRDFAFALLRADG